MYRKNTNKYSKFARKFIAPLTTFKPKQDIFIVYIFRKTHPKNILSHLKRMTLFYFDAQQLATLAVFTKREFFCEQNILGHL